MVEELDVVLGVDHFAAAGISTLPWDPGERILPYGSTTVQLRVNDRVHAPVVRNVEDKDLEGKVLRTVRIYQHACV